MNAHNAGTCNDIVVDAKELTAIIAYYVNVYGPNEAHFYATHQFFWFLAMNDGEGCNTFTQTENSWLQQNINQPGIFLWTAQLGILL